MEWINALNMLKLSEAVQALQKCVIDDKIMS